MNRAGSGVRTDDVDAAVRVLRAAGVPSPEREVTWLLEAVTGIDPTERLRRAMTPTAAEVDAVVALARRRAAGEPLQYLTGRAGFRNLELAVGPGVFIPRPETETLIDVAMRRLPHGGTVVDVGTGSGAIAAALATERRDARVLASESSPTALEWARRNIATLAPDVTLLEGDLLDPTPRHLRGAVDVVVCNPPYVARDETLPVAVVEHEPHEALFGGDGGLEVIELVAAQALLWLRPGGWLVLEIGETQASAVSALFEQLGYDSVGIVDDLLGRPRIAQGRFPGATS